MDEEEEMDEEIVATTETKMSIPKERIETSSPKNEKRNKRRRMDSDCDSITNISRLEQDMRDLRYGLHYLPQRKIEEARQRQYNKQLSWREYSCAMKDQ
ncbi:hypothetical protein RB195_022972 [Necator americanus]|uniref:Uncharacterized protein n=1 Tax=Necator americanus TaxID=51031 RepID=A0ABR1EH98_NECAM